MMKTKDEFIKALQTCVYASECGECPYEPVEGNTYVCVNTMLKELLQFLKGEG